MALWQSLHTTRVFLLRLHILTTHAGAVAPLLEWLIEVGDGFLSLFREVGSSHNLPRASVLFPFHIHAIFTDDLSYRAFFFPGDRFYQTGVVIIPVLSYLGADIRCQAVVVVETSDLRIVLRYEIQQGQIHSCIVMDGFSVGCEGFQFLA